MLQYQKVFMNNALILNAVINNFILSKVKDTYEN